MTERRLSDDEIEAAMDHEVFEDMDAKWCQQCDERWPCKYMQDLELLMRLSMIRRALR